MLRKVPLVVILGSTGTGKTKLSIELAQRFGGEIISADSMQVYRGLDIATAKATKEEQAAAPHHLLDIAVPGQPFTVVNFRDAALPVIDDLMSRNKIPIVVGGTNYYIESLLWKILVTSKPEYENVRWDHEWPESVAKKQRTADKTSASKDGDSDSSADYSNSDNEVKQERKNDAATAAAKSGEEQVTAEEKHVELSDLLKMNAVEMAKYESRELHRHLAVVDAVTANRLHPNNKRKIIRALEVFAQAGKTLSAIFDEQRNEEGGSNLGGPLRYPHVIMFWLRCDQEVLNARLDKRVDGMVEMGLLPEIRAFYDDFIKLYACTDYTKGILQTIGFKEFIPYLEKYSKDEDDRLLQYFSKDPSEKSSDPPESLSLLISCLDELKLVTRRYSKRQIKWVKNRLLGNAKRIVPPIYDLDTSDVSKWRENVFARAEKVLDAYLEEKETDIKPMEKIRTGREDMTGEKSHYCATCDKILIGDYQYNLHMKSNRHKKKLASLRKKEKKAQNKE
ncbi:tRNA dimethylallyltransferase [Culicoides brevitarsis]|uniref:tRNA dimethylallyltransferase n=1 Tax=Culicoides brevitarsis TaxID=469753 RepID=UPI00307B989F